MGASLGAALRKRGAVHRVIGIARRPQVAERAVKLGAVDEASTDHDRMAEADVIVLATPVRVILQTLDDLSGRLKEETTLTDLGSTKADILKKAEAVKLPFIGGHPMAGNERSGVDACDAGLYEGKPYLLVRAATTRPVDEERVAELARAVGARPVTLGSGAEHDDLVAAISHVPYLIAYALMEANPDEDRRRAGPAFADATRVAASHTQMVLDFLLTNGEAIGRASSALQKSLTDLTALVKRGDEEGLRSWLESIRAARQELQM